MTSEPAAQLPEAVQRRKTFRARDQGMADEEIALRLSVPVATVSRWLRDEDERARRAAEGQTTLELVIPIQRMRQLERGALISALEIAVSREDARTIIEVVREMRHQDETDIEFAARRGAFLVPQIAAPGAPADDDELDLSKMAEKLVKAFFKPGSDELTLDCLGEKLSLL